MSFQVKCRRSRFPDESNVAMATARLEFDVHTHWGNKRRTHTLFWNNLFIFIFHVGKRISLNETQKGNLKHKTTRLLKNKKVKYEQVQSIYATQVQYQIPCSDFIKNNQTRAKARQVNWGYNLDQMC